MEKEEETELALAIQLSLEQSKQQIKRRRDEVDDVDYDFNHAYAIAKSLIEPNTTITWNCDICMFTNGPLSRTCAMCGSNGQGAKDERIFNWEKGNPEEGNQEAVSDIDEAIARSLVESDEHTTTLWHCNVCSFGGNAIFLISCDSCLSPKPGFATTSASETWPCPRCTFDCPENIAVCEVCAFSRDQKSPQLLISSQCGLPGCSQKATSTGFCCQEHVSSSLRRHVIAPSELGVDRVLVGPSGDFTCHLLTKSHPMHSKIKTQFLDSWLKRESGSPAVMRIFKIRVARDIHLRYQRTASRLQNIQLLFHGTSQLPSCTFGKNPASPPCYDNNCRVCSISRTSFSIRRTGEGGGTQMALRYGRGMYFSATSSKSNDYNQGSELLLRQGDRYGRLWAWRSMFVCHVAKGHSYHTTAGSLTEDMCPPPGYDNVSGDVGPHLNYDEVVVYDESQAVPSYLVVYTIAPGM